MGSDGSDSITINTNDIAVVSGGDGFDTVTLTDASGNTVDLDGVETVMGSTRDNTDGDRRYVCDTRWWSGQ